MSFGGLILTNDGRNMMAACVGEKQILNITHVELGEGVYTGSYLNIKKLKNPVMRIPVSRVTREDNKVTIECDYYHKDAPHGFYFREIGLIGNDTLLYYDNAGEGDADYIDPDSKVLSREKRLRFVIALTDDVNITIETLSGLYALQKDLDIMQENLDTHVNEERIKWNNAVNKSGDTMTGELEVLSSIQNMQNVTKPLPIFTGNFQDETYENFFLKHRSFIGSVWSNFSKEWRSIISNSIFASDRKHYGFILWNRMQNPTEGLHWSYCDNEKLTVDRKILDSVNFSDYVFGRRDIIITNTTDWNNIIDIGCYKVQMSAWGNASSLHSPNRYLSTLYCYGLLFVFAPKDNTENRLVQIYIPHPATNVSYKDKIILYRFSNSGGWDDWKSLPSNGLDGDGNNIADTYLKKSGGEITGNLKLDRGYYVHYAKGNTGTAGYAKIATIKIMGSYENFPIMIGLARRGGSANGEHTKLYINFDNSNTTDPELVNFIYTGADTRAHLHKTAEGMWDLYIQKSEAYDVIVVTDYSSAYGVVGNTEIAPDIEWKDERAVSSPPTGSVPAKLGGIVNLANKAVNDGSGNNIPNTYQTKVIKSMSGYHSDLNTNTVNSDNIYNLEDIIKGHDKAIGTVATEIEESKKTPIKTAGEKLMFASGDIKIESKECKNIQCFLGGIYTGRHILNLAINTTGVDAGLLNMDYFVYSISGYHMGTGGSIIVYLTVYNKTNYIATIKNNSIPVLVTYMNDNDIT